MTLKEMRYADTDGIDTLAAINASPLTAEEFDTVSVGGE